MASVYVLCVRYCRAEATAHENCEAFLSHKHLLPNLALGFRLWVIFWPRFVWRLWGFLVLLSLMFCICGLKCRLIISLTSDFDFLFKGEKSLCKPTHTHTIFVSLRHLLRGMRRVAVRSCTLFSKLAGYVLTDPTGWPWFPPPSSKSFWARKAFLPYCLCPFTWLIFPWSLYSYFMVLASKNKDMTEKHAWRWWFVVSWWFGWVTVGLFHLILAYHLGSPSQAVVQSRW